MLQLQELHEALASSSDGDLLASSSDGYLRVQSTSEKLLVSNSSGELASKDTLRPAGVLGTARRHVVTDYDSHALKALAKRECTHSWTGFLTYSEADVAQLQKQAKRAHTVSKDDYVQSEEYRKQKRARSDLCHLPDRPRLSALAVPGVVYCGVKQKGGPLFKFKVGSTQSKTARWQPVCMHPTCAARSGWKYGGLYCDTHVKVHVKDARGSLRKRKCDSLDDEGGEDGGDDGGAGGEDGEDGEESIEEYLRRELEGIWDGDVLNAQRASDDGSESDGSYVVADPLEWSA